MEKIKQAVILVGGKGVRLRPLTLTTPKPMILIHGKPLLYYIVTYLRQNGITHILLLTGYKHKKIEEYFKDGKEFGISISYSNTPVSDKTGTRLKKAKKYLDDQFLLLYGDNYLPQKLDDIFNAYIISGKKALVTVYSNFDRYTQNNIQVENGVVKLYDSSRKNKLLNGVDIGFFVLKKNEFQNLPKTNFSFEEVIIPRLIRKKELTGFITHHKYYGLSNLNRIKDIEEFFLPKKVVFLDRDGVINKKNKRASYITDWSHFKFLPRVKTAFKLLHKKGYTIFIVTNQPGISRKMITENKLEEIHSNLIKELKKKGVEIKEIFVCKHGWDEGCFCRKPSPGMFFQAQKYHIDLSNSYCIGDDERDIIAGQLAGCKTFLVNKKNDLYTIVQKHL